MLPVEPIVLSDGRVRLEPLGLHHLDGLARAAADGELWTIRVTSVPDPDDTRGYVERALQSFAEGHRLAFAVLDATCGEVIGSSSYHDIVPAVERLEIGYTWYAKSRQRTHVNASAKLVGWRTDNFNFASQRAIERLGARKDGILRHHALRRDGTIRDTVMYSMTAGEWPEAKAELRSRLARASD